MGTCSLIRLYIVWLSQTCLYSIFYKKIFTTISHLWRHSAIVQHNNNFAKVQNTWHEVAPEAQTLSVFSRCCMQNAVYLQLIYLFVRHRSGPHSKFLKKISNSPLLRSYLVPIFKYPVAFYLLLLCHSTVYCSEVSVMPNYSQMLSVTTGCYKNPVAFS